MATPQGGIDGFGDLSPKHDQVYTYGDGWNLFTVENMKEILIGSDRLKGYFDRERAVSLDELGLQWRDIFGRIDLECNGRKYIDDYGAKPEGGKRYLSDFWTAYEKRNKNRKIVFARVSGEGDPFMYLPVKYRGSEDYERFMRGRVRRIGANWSDTIKGTTLTISPRCVGNPFDIFLQITGLLNKFLTWLFKMRVSEKNSKITLKNKKRREQGKRPLPYVSGRVPYVWAIEPNERGYPHFHFIFEANWLHPAKEVLRWWKMEGVDIQHAGVEIQPIHGGNQKRNKDNPYDKPVIHYITKYITKTAKNPVWNAVLTMTRKRAWGCSRNLTKSDLDGLVPTVGREEQFQLFFKRMEEGNPIYDWILEPEWVYLGTFPVDFIEWYQQFDPPPEPDEIQDLYYLTQTAPSNSLEEIRFGRLN